jgi:hypothetical protein
MRGIAMRIRAFKSKYRPKSLYACRIHEFTWEATPMIGKRVQLHDETWHELRVLASASMKSFQELADEAFNDLLRKHGRPASLKEALRRSAGESAKVIPLKRNPRSARRKK